MFSNPANTRAERRLNLRTRSLTDAPHYRQESLFDLPTRANGTQLLPTNAHYRQQHLQIQPVPPHLTVGDLERVWLIESETGLQIPGQFSADEADVNLEISQRWNWLMNNGGKVA